MIKNSLTIMVNVSNLKVGGGLQVADSVCRELYKYPQHRFIVVYDKWLAGCAKAIEQYDNVETVEYETPIDLKTVLTGRDKFLDKLVAEKGVGVVLTIFGPSRWKPKVPHLSGFALSHLLLPESPYWKQVPIKKLLPLKIKLNMIKYSFAKCADNYFTENPFITERLQKMFPRKKVFTVTNNANQIFQMPDLWDKSIELPGFDGVTMLTVAANYPHKNLPIIVPVCHFLEEHYHDLKFRFVLTVREEDLAEADECAKRHIVFLGPVKIEQVPYLYAQSDIMFLPTLLECFSACYAEAMVMKKPVLTTDLVFARGLCGDAAFYYDAVSPSALGDAIVRLSDEPAFREQLVANGLKQLQHFDTFEQRAEKLIKIVEGLV